MYIVVSLLFSAQCKLLKLYCTFSLFESFCTRHRLITYPDIHFPSIKGSLNLLLSTWTKYPPPLQPSRRVELACIVSADQPLWWLTALPPQNICHLTQSCDLPCSLIASVLMGIKLQHSWGWTTAYITNINFPFRLINLSVPTFDTF